MQVQFGKAYRLNQVTLNGQRPSDDADARFFNYPSAVLQACADHLDVNRPEEKTPAVTKSHKRPNKGLGPEFYEKLGYVFTDEDAVLLSLVEQITDCAGHDRLNAQVKLDDPRFQPAVQELKKHYGLDAAQHFAEKGLQTYGDFARVDFEVQKAMRSIEQERKYGDLEQDPWMEALKRILKADPEQPIRMNADFTATQNGGYQVKKLDILNV